MLTGPAAAWQSLPARGGGVRPLVVYLACMLGASAMSVSFRLDAAVAALPRSVLVDGSVVVRVLPRLVAEPSPVELLPGLPMISDASWTETAVRKVLHIFAFGGHASDSQVQAWADMPPDRAIAEMLTTSTTTTSCRRMRMDCLTIGQPVFRVAARVRRWCQHRA